MNKSALFKIAGIIVVSFVVITVATFFLYPYLNEEKYEQIQAERSERTPSNSFQSETEDELLPIEAEGDSESESVTDEKTRVFDGDKNQLLMKLDSLMAVNDSLSLELESAQTGLTNLENVLKQTGVDPQQLASVKQGEGNVEFIIASEEPREEFSERVKSLLNLDEEELTPIANQMSQQELVRIYSSSGNIQREKLLRSLSAERAANLMKEIML